VGWVGQRREPLPLAVRGSALVQTRTKAGYSMGRLPEVGPGNTFAKASPRPPVLLPSPLQGHLRPCLGFAKATGALDKALPRPPVPLPRPCHSHPCSCHGLAKATRALAKALPRPSVLQCLSLR
jgi:hypothetical protein